MEASVGEGAERSGMVVVQVRDDELLDLARATMPSISSAAAGVRAMRRPRLVPSATSNPQSTTMVRLALRITQTK